MKTVPQTLRTLIFGGNAFAWADLFSFHFRSGVRRWTTAAGSLSTPDARTFAAGEVVIPRPTAKADAKLEAAEVELPISALDTVTLDGLTLGAAAARGLFDGVRVVVERAGLDASGAVVGTFVLFDGEVEEVSPTSVGVLVTVTSPVAKLATHRLPARLMQPSCPFALYGPQCGLVESAWTDTRTIASGSTGSVLKLSATSTRAEVGGWVVIGGERRGIRAVSGVAVTLDSPLATVPAVGTSVSVTAGCARTRAACRVKGNITYFGGTPDVPTSEE